MTEALQFSGDVRKHLNHHLSHGRLIILLVSLGFFSIPSASASALARIAAASASPLARIPSASWTMEYFCASAMAFCASASFHAHTVPRQPGLSWPGPPAPARTSWLRPRAGVWSGRQRQPVQWHTGPHLLFVDLSFQCLLLYQYFLFTQFGLAFSPGNLGVDRGGLDGFLLFLFLNLVGSVGLRFLYRTPSAVRPS